MKRLLDPSAFARDVDLAIAELRAVRRDYLALFSAGYEPLRRGGLEKPRRGTTGAGAGLDRVRVDGPTEGGPPADFDGLETVRQRLASASSALTNALRFAVRARRDLGDVATDLDRLHREVAQGQPVERPPRPCQPCKGEGRIRDGRRFRVCPDCEGSGRERPAGMTPAQAAEFQARRAERLQRRLNAGVPFEVASGEVYP